MTNTTSQMEASVENLGKNLTDISHKIDVIEMENSTLDHEIEMAKASLDQAQKEYEQKQEQVKKLKDMDELIKEEKKAKQELQAIQEKVLTYLELTEDLESDGVFDEEATGRALLREREEKERLLQSIRADLETKLKELRQLEKNRSV